MRKHIPNLFTLGNLLCGILAIRFFLQGEFDLPIYLLTFAAVLDFFDGFVARALKVAGDLGKQLDSLADLVSFGVAPAMGLSTLMERQIYYHSDLSPYPLGELVVFSPYLIALFSALRLAKFNIDTRQTDSFIGLPTPASTILIGSLIWGITHGTIDPSWVYRDLVWIVPLFSILVSWMLVAELPLIALKFKHFKWKGNEPRFILILSSIAIFALFGISGFAIVVLLYLLISIIDHRIHRHEVSR